MAAAMALGAQGAWTGSIWLTVAESDTRPWVVENLLAASWTDTVRSRAMTGKPARQLRTAWTEAWESSRAPPAAHAAAGDHLRRVRPPLHPGPEQGAVGLAGGPDRRGT